VLNVVGVNHLPIAVVNVPRVRLVVDEEDGGLPKTTVDGRVKQAVVIVDVVEARRPRQPVVVVVLVIVVPVVANVYPVNVVGRVVQAVVPVGVVVVVGKAKIRHIISKQPQINQPVFTHFDSSFILDSTNVSAAH
jgi:hypothetical protein